MSDLAASGGYYIAMPGHVIVAQPGTLTGSIGIFSGKFVTGGTFDKLGANVEAVSDGKFADMNSPIAPVQSPEERAKVEEQMQAFYDQFVEKVAAGAKGRRRRRSTRSRRAACGPAGRRARWDSSTSSAGWRARWPSRRSAPRSPRADAVDIVVYPPKPSFFEALSRPFGRTEESRLNALVGALPAGERRVLRDLAAPIRLLQRGDPLALMPYVFLR